MRIVGVCLVLLVLGCNDKKEAGSGSGSAVAEAPKPPPPPPPPAADAAAPVEADAAVSTEPPKVSGVLFAGLKLAGKARTQEDARSFVDKAVTPYLKACVKDEQPFTSVSVQFVIGKDGVCSNAATTAAASNGDKRTLSDTATACITKAIEAMKMDTPAKDIVKPTVMLMVNPNAP